MKIYGLPTQTPAPIVDYSNFDGEKTHADETAHSATLKTFLIKNGYTGKHTGSILRMPVADGQACYMFGDTGKADSILVHLPYGDAWNSPDAEFLPRKEVLRRIACTDSRPTIPPLR